MNLYEVKEKLFDTFREWGFSDLDRAYYIIRELLDKAPDLPEKINTILEACASSFSPDEALINLSRFIDTSFSPYSLIKELADNEVYLRVASLLCSASNYLASILMVDPSVFYGLFERGFLVSPDVEELQLELQGFIDNFHTDEGFLDALNHFKMKHVLLYAARELCQLDDIDVTTQNLSQLADLILNTVYLYNKKNFSGCRLAIFSMGKLGGEEVNFSSDLDLIFVGEEPMAENVGDFGKKIIANLSYQSRYGYLYRIDMRLRPEGNYAPLVTGVNYLKNYFHNRARTWEKQAYIRARFSAGDRDIGQAGLAAIEHFVFYSSLTMEDIRSIIFIKNEMDDSVGENSLVHVKKGRGGIRDIEFIVQAFQLLFAHRVPELKRANIFAGLTTLYNHEMLSFQEFNLLSEAYFFLRRVEHYLQLKENLQVFELPSSEQKKRVLARMLLFPSLEEFEKYYVDIRDKVRHLFTDLFSRVFGEGEIAPVSEIVMNPEVEEKDALELLNGYGFEDTRSVFRFLRELAALSPRIRIALALSLNYILTEIAESAHPDKRFFNLFSAVKSYGAISIFLRLIRYDSAFREILTRVVAESDVLTAIISQSPGIIDVFIDPEALEENTAIGDYYRLVLDSNGGNVEQAVVRLKNELFFKTAIREYGGGISTQEAGHILSDTVDYCVRESAAHLADKNTAKYLVLALGRLGCREMTFASDADVVFLFEGKREERDGYAELFLQLTDFLKPVIELDARLRPDGKSAPVTMNSAAFSAYLKDKGQFWERIAYLKARPVAQGDTRSEEVMKNIREFVLGGDIRRDREEIMELRQKIHDAFSQTGNFHIKKDSGGLLDIDFLLFRRIRAEHRKQYSASMWDNLDSLGDKKLAEIYGFYRRLENICRVSHLTGGSVIEFEGREADYVRRRMGFDERGGWENLIRQYRDYVVSQLEKK